MTSWCFSGLLKKISHVKLAVFLAFIDLDRLNYIGIKPCFNSFPTHMLDLIIPLETKKVIA